VLDLLGHEKPGGAQGRNRIVFYAIELLEFLDIAVFQSTHQCTQRLTAMRRVTGAERHPQRLPHVVLHARDDFNDSLGLMLQSAGRERPQWIPIGAARGAAASWQACKK
jgi:hypothetical protein